jgi:hypothetical protein
VSRSETRQCLGAPDYVGLAFVVEPDGDETEVRASLRSDGDDWGDWGGYLIGPADWIAIASSTEPFFELRLPDGRSGACFIADFDQASTTQRVTIAGLGGAPFG